MALWRGSKEAHARTHWQVAWVDAIDGGFAEQKLGSAVVGRDEQLGLIRSLVVEAAEGGAVLLLTGEPGVGKTVLLDAAAEAAAAAGTRVLRAAGVEFEADVSYSGTVLLAGRGDTQAARAAFDEAIGRYEALGAEWDIRRASARLSIRASRRWR